MDSSVRPNQLQLTDIDSFNGKPKATERGENTDAIGLPLNDALAAGSLCIERFARNDPVNQGPKSIIVLHELLCQIGNFVLIR